MTQRGQDEVVSEEWRPVSGYEGFYEISNLGRLKSLARPHARKDRICKSSQMTNGYLMANLSRGGKTARIMVHRLVLQAFIGPPKQAQDHGCHNDGDKKNNALTNLRWDTASNNNLDKLRHGRMANGERHGFAKLAVAEVLEIRRLVSSGYCRYEVASLFKSSYGNVTNICNRRTWKHV